LSHDFDRPWLLGVKRPKLDTSQIVHSNLCRKENKYVSSTYYVPSNVPVVFRPLSKLIGASTIIIFNNIFNTETTFQSSMSVIPALKRLRQEDCEASLAYIETSYLKKRKRR
jgi:hypothetical protein